MEKKLQRNEQEKTVAGVCAGLAEYFDVDVTWVRIAFVLAVLAGLSGLLAYVILWIAVPAKPYIPNYGQFNADYRVDKDANAPVNDPSLSGMPPYPKKKRDDGASRIVIGSLFIIFGFCFLIDEFDFIPYWFDLGKLWPLVFIIPGIMMIVKANKKSRKDEWKEEMRTRKENESVNTAGNTPEEPTINSDSDSKL